MQTPRFVEDFVFGSSPSESITWLLQQLIECNGTVGVTLNNQHPFNAETILALDMDGFHYTLTRRCVESSAAKYRLSPREQEIVRLVAKGFPNKSIATILDISRCTVATHIRRIFDKTSSKSRAEMVARVYGY